MKTLSPGDILSRPLLQRKPHIQLLSSGEFIVYVLVSKVKGLYNTDILEVAAPLHKRSAMLSQFMIECGVLEKVTKYCIIDAEPIGTNLYLRANMWSKK